ncbi:MAG: 30S ribosomal protein S12 methylthiotransferase RimO [Desulfobacterium sp.]|nr:30S ribosomal protein S12 methylthiotransferase RimO [Desulfobacterium sp.]
MKLHLASLGCARNLVDSETMLGHLVKSGWDITQEPSEADAIIINTCSFISDAINESIDTILELAKFKKNGNCKQLLVAGCLPERFREELAETLPEVDFFLGTGAYDQVAHILERHPARNKQICLLPNPEKASFPETDVPRISTSDTTAYVKIAEGCSRHCTYCIIPRLRGKHRSRPANDILHEARLLVQSGVKELTLVAQDTTYYGKDLFPPSNLAVLLTQLSEISEDIWLRFLYGHPESIDENVMKTIARHPNICSYFDIPIQHASNRILKKMGRNYSLDDLRKLYDTIRTTIPDAALRTTIITGFPGETEKDFSILMDFIQEIRFDHLGVFTYSDSNDLPSHKLPLPVDEHTANQRQDLLMNQQAVISAANNQEHIDKTYPVLIESRESDNVFIGRTFFQAPEVDGITFVSSRNLKLGDFVQTRIKNSFEYDLSGEPV